MYQDCEIFWWLLNLCHESFSGDHILCACELSQTNLFTDLGRSIRPPESPICYGCSMSFCICCVPSCPCSLTQTKRVKTKYKKQLQERAWEHGNISISASFVITHHRLLDKMWTELPEVTCTSSTCQKLNKTWTRGPPVREEFSDSLSIALLDVWTFEADEICNPLPLGHPPRLCPRSLQCLQHPGNPT